MPDVYFLPIVMDGRDQSKLIAPDVEDGEPIHLIGGRERHPQIGEGGIVGLPNDGEPGVQRGTCVRMYPRKFHQPLSSNYVHTANDIST